MRSATRSVAVFVIVLLAGCGSKSGEPSGAAGAGPEADAAGPTGVAGTTGAAGAPGAAGTGAAGTGAAGTTAAAGKTGTAGAAGGAGTGGKTGTAGTTGASGTGGTASAGCDAPGLVWKTGSKTNFTSYPEPGSAECIQYNGCMYEGQFAGCNQTEPLSWVMSHNIVAAFPDFTALKLHDLCLKSSGGKTIVVTVLDTCGDGDCNGCCTHNKGTADELIDVESFTDMRWGVSDGRIQWADLGPTKSGGCQ